MFMILIKRSIFVVTIKILAGSYFIILPPPVRAEFSAIIEQEFSFNEQLNSEKYETLIKPEWRFDYGNNAQFVFKPKLRFDGLNRLSRATDKPENYSGINGTLFKNSHLDLMLDELYFDLELENTYWRIGKQQVVWGQADGLKILDVINPQNFREFILDEFEDSRIPLWMLNIEIPINDESNLQVLWIPDLTYHEFAEPGSTFQITSPIFVPQISDNFTLGQFVQNKPNSFFFDSDLGLRYATFYRGWDLTLNYLFFYDDSPVLYQQLEDSRINIDSRYQRSHLVGATANNVFGDLTLRTEIGYRSKQYYLMHFSPQIISEYRGVFETNEISSVIGLDWQGFDDIFLSFQWFQSYLFDYHSQVAAPRNNHIVSLLYRQSFENENWQFELLHLYGLDKTDSSLQLEISYLLEDNFKIWAGADFFSGDIQGLFGQFSDKDRITMGFEWGI